MTTARPAKPQVTPVTIDRSQVRVVCSGCLITTREDLVRPYRLPAVTLHLCHRCIAGLAVAAMVTP